MDRFERGVALVIVGFCLLTVGSSVVAMADGAFQSADGDFSQPVLVGTQSTNDNATVTRYFANGSRDWQYRRAYSYHVVQRLPSGQVLASYRNDTDDCPAEYAAPCGVTGVRFFWPENGTITWNWNITTRTGSNSEIHDAEYLPEQDAILLADMDRERIMLLDRQTKAVRWQWIASDHYAPPADVTRRDWLHINDVDRIGDGRYLISVRNANQLLIVERGRGVVEIINRDHNDGNDGACHAIDAGWLVPTDGSERCGSPAVMRGQHNPQWLGDGRVLVADSENDRIVELERRGGEWSVVSTWREAAGTGFWWPRDADRLANGHTLVTDTRNDRVVELGRGGRAVAAVETPGEPYAAVADGREYPAGPPVDHTASDTIPDVPIQAVQTVYGGLTFLRLVPPGVGQWHLLGLFGVLYLCGVVGARRVISQWW